MKKLFVNPEVSSVELSLNDVILASDNIANPNVVDYGSALTDDTESNDIWKGLGDGNWI